MQRPEFTPVQILAIYTVLALLMRVFSFFPSVINHDESTYILIANEILSGKIYLQDVIDTKPVGIFLLFAGFLTVLGNSILAIRALTAFWIVLTAFGICRVHKNLGGRGAAPFASGLIYIVITSIYTYYGISPNTEIFFNLFTILALWLLLRPQQKMTQFFLAGLCLGAGFLIKYVVLFDALAFCLFFLWQSIRKQWQPQQTLSLFAACASGFAIPFGAVFLFYWSANLSERFVFYAFEVSKDYFIEQHWFDYVKYVLESFGRFGLVSFFFFYALFDRSVRLRTFNGLIAIWSLCVLYIILLPGKLFSHYFIQFMLPLSLMAGSFFDARRTLPVFLAKIFTPKIGYAVLGLLVGVNFWFQKKDYFDKPDYAQQIADYLDDKLKPEDAIYTGNYHQIIYHLLDRESPTPYVHRSLLWDEKNVEALEINRAQELQRILRQAPRFIIYEGDLPRELPFGKIVKQQYRRVKTFEEDIHVYERGRSSGRGKEDYEEAVAK